MKLKEISEGYRENLEKNEVLKIYNKNNEENG